MGSPRIKDYFTQVSATVSWRLTNARFSGETARVIGELNKNGIATTSVEKLALDRELFGRLADKCRVLAGSPDALRRNVQRKRDLTSKDYLFQLLGSDLIEVSGSDIFLRFALDPLLLAIVNSYLGCYSRLTYHDVWLNLPCLDKPHASQLWHRDPGDVKIIKIFILISSVTTETGAFSYIPGTQKGGRHEALDPPVIFEGNVPRTLDEQMRRMVPESQWVTATGPSGTIIFADTRGFHKGGFVQRDNRLLFTAMYNRWVTRSNRKVQVNPLSAERLTSRAAQWAVRN